MINQPVDNFKPQLKDLLDLFKKDVMLDFNCHAIAKVESFDPSVQTISASVVYCKTVYVDNVKTLVEYPLLMDVPVIILGGGNASLTFPITKGDECLILFNDRDIDNWMFGAMSGPVASTRLHSFSDGIALIGFPQIDSYEASKVKLCKGETLLTLGDKIKLANSSLSLKELFSELQTDLKTFTNSISMTPDATNPATTMALAQAIKVAAVQLDTSLATFSTKISELLE